MKKEVKSYNGSEFKDDEDVDNGGRTASDKYMAWAKGRYYSGETTTKDGSAGFNLLENKEAMGILAESGYSADRVKEILDKAKKGDDTELDHMIEIIGDYVGTDFEALNAKMEEMLASTADDAQERLDLLNEGKISEDTYLKAAHTAIAEEAWDGLD
jgi:hypothetical protein